MTMKTTTTATIRPILVRHRAQHHHGRRVHFDSRLNLQEEEERAQRGQALRKKLRQQLVVARTLRVQEHRDRKRAFDIFHSKDYAAKVREMLLCERDDLFTKGLAAMLRCLGAPQTDLLSMLEWFRNSNLYYSKHLRCEYEFIDSYLLFLGRAEIFQKRFCVHGNDNCSTSSWQQHLPRQCHAQQAAASYGSLLDSFSMQSSTSTSSSAEVVAPAAGSPGNSCLSSVPSSKVAPSCAADAAEARPPAWLASAVYGVVDRPKSPTSVTRLFELDDDLSRSKAENGLYYYNDDDYEPRLRSSRLQQQQDKACTTPRGYGAKYALRRALQYLWFTLTRRASHENVGLWSSSHTLATTAMDLMGSVTDNACCYSYWYDNDDDSTSFVPPILSATFA